MEMKAGNTITFDSEMKLSTQVYLKILIIYCY